MVVKQKNRQRFILTFVAICFGLVGSSVSAQTAKKTAPASSAAVAQTKSQSDKPVKLSARFHIEKGKIKGFLIVRAEVKNGSYIYGMNQKKPMSPSQLVSVKMNEIKSLSLIHI